MAIGEIFNSVILASCGLCCDSGKPLCEKCEISTLEANGLSRTLSPKITGLSKIWYGNGGFQYSDLYEKIKELKK